MATEVLRHCGTISQRREYLRIGAVYRLLDRRRIDKPRAIALLAERKVHEPKALVELWLSGPLTEKNRLARKEWAAHV